MVYITDKCLWLFAIPAYPSFCSDVDSQVYQQQLYYLEVVRLRPSHLIDWRFTSGQDEDYLQFPGESIFISEPEEEVRVCVWGGGERV